MSKPTKLFVTGVAGRLGRAIVKEAAVQGIAIVGIDQKPFPSDTPLPSSIETHVASFTDRDVLTKLMAGCDGVIHTAGPNGEQVGKAPLELFMQVNVTALAVLLEVATELGVGAVAVSSTMEVLIGRAWARSGMAVLDDDSPAQSDSPYALSRRTAETLVTEYHKMTGLSTVSLRYVAFGYRGDDDLGANLLARSLTAADVARANLLAATNTNLAGEVVNIGPETPLTNADIVEALKNPAAVLERYWPGSTAILEQLDTKLRPENFWPITRIRRANQLLGWKPQTTFTTWLTSKGWTPPSNV